MYTPAESSLHCTLYNTAVSFQIQGLEGCLSQPSGEMRAGQQVGLLPQPVLGFQLSDIQELVLKCELSLLFQVSTLKSGHAFLH